MLEDIIDSRIKAKIIGLLVRRNAAMSGSDISRVLNGSKSRISECLRELRDKGVLNEKRIGRTILYSLSSNPIANSVRIAFSWENKLLEEIEKNFVAECQKLKPISIALFGSAVNGLKGGSDVDILILYEKTFDKNKLSDIASRLTAESSIRVSPIAMDIKKFIADAKAGNEFVINILAGYKLLYGKDLEVLIWRER